MDRRTLLKWLGGIALSPSLVSLDGLRDVARWESERLSSNQTLLSTANVPTTLNEPQIIPASHVNAHGTTGTIEQSSAPASSAAARLPTDGRLMNIAEFQDHIATLDLQRVTQVVIHHTYIPDETTWRQRGGWAFYRGSLQSHYASLGWTRGPHLFISYEGIGLFYDMTQTGRGVGGRREEIGALHIEMVGDYMTHLPAGDTLDNAVQAAAAIMRQTKASLTHHSLMVRGTECPGARLRKDWGWFRGLVQEAMEQPEPLPQEAEPEIPSGPTILEWLRVLREGEHTPVSQRTLMQRLIT